MPTETKDRAEEFRQLQSGATITEQGKELTFIRFRGGKATCVDKDGKRVNIPSAPPTPPVQSGETGEANGEGGAG